MVINMPSHNTSRRATEKSLVIADRPFKISAIASKIDQDIAFLEGRLTGIEASRSANPVIRETYQTMLDSRLSVKSWLDQYRNSDVDDQTDLAGIAALNNQVI